MQKKFNSFETVIKILFICVALFFCALTFTTDPSYKSPWQLSTAEDDIVENLTAIFCLLGGYFCIKNFFRRKKLLSQNALLILLGGMLFLFVGFEEISWGQRIIGLQVVGLENLVNYQGEINLHNIEAIEDIIIFTGFAAVGLIGGILPILTYWSRRIKKLVLKCKIPLMPKVICISAWLGFIFYGFLPAFIVDRHVSTELTELYFPFILFAYVFCDYFYLLKYGKPYDFKPEKAPSPEKKSFFASAAEDISMTLRHNKILIAITVFVYFTVLPLSSLWREYVRDLDQQIFYEDASLTIIEGENLEEANSRYRYRNKKGAFGKGYLHIYTKSLPKEQYIFLKYVMPVQKAGKYNIFFAGYPPGTKEEGEIYFTFCSPFEVFIDGKKVRDISAQSQKKYLLETTGSIFYTFYRYAPSFRITKLGEYYLAEGDHEIEFRIYQKTLYSDYYVFAIDAIFLTPVGWQPKKPSFSFPGDMLSH